MATNRSEPMKNFEAAHPDYKTHVAPLPPYTLEEYQACRDYYIACQLTESRMSFLLYNLFLKSSGCMCSNSFISLR